MNRTFNIQHSIQRPKPKAAEDQKRRNEEGRGAGSGVQCASFLKGNLSLTLTAIRWRGGGILMGGTMPGAALADSLAPGCHVTGFQPFRLVFVGVGQMGDWESHEWTPMKSEGRDPKSEW